MSWAHGEMERRLHGLVRVGTVLQVDASKARAKVALGGEAVSAWVPWIGRAGTVSEWSPLAAGEQVAVLSPGGDTAQGVILGSLFSSDNPAKSQDGGEWRIELGGSHISMTGEAITLSSNGSTLTLDASGIRLNGARVDLN